MDLGTPGDGQIGLQPDEPQSRRLALRHAYLSAQQDALVHATPPGVAKELEATRAELRRLQADREGVKRGIGPAVPEEVRVAYLRAVGDEAQVRSRRLALERDGPGLFARRRLTAELARAQVTAIASRERFDALAGPHRRRLDAQISALVPRFNELSAHDAADRAWLRLHPEASGRFMNLAKELRTLEHRIENRRRALEGRHLAMSPEERRLAPELHRGRTVEHRREPPTPRRGMGRSL